MANSPQTPSTAIEMREVSVGAMRDQSIVAAKGINWNVAAGEYWIVAGLQGSGKGDFLMMTGGLMAPLEGQYRFFGEPMPIFEETRLKERLRLGLVFETGQLFNHLTVSENIEAPLHYHENLTMAEAKARVQPFLETMGLGPWADSTPGAIGRNWQKRVGLARALVLKPEVLLLDSPLAGLDLRHANWWFGFLDELSNGHPLLGGKPMTLVVTAADLRPWKGSARQFAVLKDQQFSVVGDWTNAESSADEHVRELLTA